MTTLLILGKQQALASAIEAVLDPGDYQIVTRQDVWEAESLAARGALDVIILDTELTDVRAIRTIEEVKACVPGCPVVVFAGAKMPEWEEDAWLAGVSHILTKPVRGKLLNTLLQRLPGVRKEKPAAPAKPAHAPVEVLAQRVVGDQFRPLAALRDFSEVLSHNLECETLLKQFLLLLRKIIGLNRAAVFLRRPLGAGADTAPDDRSMRAVCAVGLEQGLLDHFTLSLRGGIGGYLHREGRVLRAGSPEAQADSEILKEFQLLGGQVAIPILDRQSLLGAAVLDGHVTGEPYSSEELAAIFHMLEEVGLAIRNTWLHNQMRSNHETLDDVLSQMPTGCVVVSDAMAVLHANAAAKKVLGRDAAGRLEFSDVPQDLGSKIFAVLKSGVAAHPFKHQFAATPAAIHRVTISPIKTQSASAPNAALLLVEDITRDENARRLEMEASNLRLTKSMAEHLAHEIGNSLVPLSTHQQLLSDRYDELEFRASLETALTDSVKRISRLTNQMMFLARDKADLSGSVKIADLIVEAFQDAHAYHPGKMARLNFDKSAEPWVVVGDHKALKHALCEVMLNALQANPENPNIAVRVKEEPDAGVARLDIEVRDAGSGFTRETAEKAQEPFFSTRTVGLGLGLTVTRKIIESHRGRVEIPASAKGEPGIVRISLPLGLAS
jgi:signal transduction histidine kinase/DNA-binding response OmpR family regulator